MVASIERTRNPFVIVAAISYLMAGLFAGTLLLFVLLTPRDHQKLVDTKIDLDQRGMFEEMDHSGGCQQPTGVIDEAQELAAERLPVEQRNHILLLSAIYGIQTAWMVGSLEAATSMILEVEFAWSTRDAGWAVGVVFLGTVPYMLFGESMKKCLRLREIEWMVCCASLSVLAGCALFPFLTERTTVILLADGFIFASCNFARGVVDGLAFRSCGEDSWLSTSQYLLVHAVLQMAVSRPFGPILARCLMDEGGRGSYALGQVLLALSGVACCSSVASIMSHQGARQVPVNDVAQSSVCGVLQTASCESLPPK
jgi:hypothetical protein